MQQSPETGPDEVAMNNWLGFQGQMQVFVKAGLYLWPKAATLRMGMCIPSPVRCENIISNGGHRVLLYLVQYISRMTLSSDKSSQSTAVADL